MTVSGPELCLHHPALHHLRHEQLLLLLERQPVLHLDPVRRRCDEQRGRTRLRGECCRWRRCRTGQPLRCMRWSLRRHGPVSVGGVLDARELLQYADWELLQYAEKCCRSQV